MEKQIIIDDFDKKEIKGGSLTLSIDNSLLKRTDRFFQLFLKKKDLHFSSIQNLKAYIKKHKLIINGGLRVTI